jgi:sugar phosphate isomerase/epimerase
MAVADDFNAAGEAAQAMGLGFGYHNHAWEFESLSDGTTPYDLLLERCDPSLVSMQMDIFWAVHAGADPLQYFGAYPGRFTSVHVKDRTADGEMVAVGTGVIDFETIMARADQAGIEHYFVEHDNPVDPLEDVRISFATLHGILS